uniref:Uncharacterized protein n=1 Tax=Gallus gallus TaxID=9031 RepID=A0A8V0ZVX4_CHICK
HWVAVAQRCAGSDCTAQHQIALHSTGSNCTALHNTGSHCTGQPCTALDQIAQHCTALDLVAQHSGVYFKPSISPKDHLKREEKAKASRMAGRWPAWPHGIPACAPRHLVNTSPAMRL